MVVRTQCGGIFPDHTLPGPDVLFCTESSKPPGLFVPPFHHSLLVAHLYLYLGRTASPALLVTSGLGTILRRCVLDHAHFPFVGWYAQWALNASRSLG